MKLRQIAYWIATALTALAFLSGGLFQLAGVEEARAGIAALGYPPYFAAMLGVWKVLGAAVILAPRMPLVKEWAYAGIAFDLTAAAYSHVAVGDPAAKAIVPFVVLAIAAASWALRPASRMLAGVRSDRAALTEVAFHAR